MQKQFQWDFSANRIEDSGASGGVSAALRTLYYANGGNISMAVDGIAVAATNRMREGVGAITVAGEVTLLMTVVRVHWPWLADVSCDTELVCRGLSCGGDRDVVEAEGCAVEVFTAAVAFL